MSQTRCLLICSVVTAVFIVLAISISYCNNYGWANYKTVKTPLEDHQEPELEHSSVGVVTTNYKILFYTLYFRRPWPQEIGNNELQCDQYRCIVTRSKKDIDSSDAVVFLGRAVDLDSCIFEGKNHRLPSQRWIFCNRESPVNSPDYHRFKGIFNWTMTYRLNSDIWYPYGYVKPGQHRSGFDPKMNYLDGRNKSIIAVISNYVSPRLKMVKSLMKYIDVDIFGACGHKSLCRDDECFYSLLNEYKFYLSFENTLCKDYITEKTYQNSFDGDIVPVILSGANLSNPDVIPQGSYIDARKFASAKELADQLIQVGSNPKLYNKLFEWRAHWTTTVVKIESTEPSCRICKKLHESNNGSFKTYEDMGNLHDKSIDCEQYPAAWT